MTTGGYIVIARDKRTDLMEIDIPAVTSKAAAIKAARKQAYQYFDRHDTVGPVTYTAYEYDW